MVVIGQTAMEDIVIQTGADRYTEKVTIHDTGEVVHNTDERLSDHKGHGSDKAANPNGLATASTPPHE